MINSCIGSKMIRKIYNIYKREGLFIFSSIVLKRLKLLSTRLIVSPITIPLSVSVILLSPWIYIRFIKLASNRIGHHSFDTELLLSILDLEIKAHKRTKNFFYLEPGQPICNTQLHKMWKRVIFILPFPYIIAEIDRYLSRWKKNYKNDPLKHYLASHDVCDQWDILGKIKETRLSFTSAEDEKAKILLKKLGIPPGAQYICLLARDSAYLDKYMPNNNWSYHNHRDVNIDDYQQAALFLAEKGYFVIRIGKYVKTAFNVNHPRVIDYASHPLRSDFLDIYLSANCFFFISTSTGIDGVAKIFRRPLLVTNYPLSEPDIFTHGRTLFIPKKVLNLNNNQLLSFNEICQIFSDAARNKLVIQVLQDKKIRFIDNTPTEITEAVAEMLARLTKDYQPTEEDTLLQNLFWENFPWVLSNRLPEIKWPIFTEKGIKFEIAPGYLRKNKYLLDNRQQDLIQDLINDQKSLCHL